MSDMVEETVSYAGFWLRVVASLIDTLLLMLITIPLILLFFGAAYWQSTAFVRGPVDFLISWVLPAVLVILFWIYKSATPGKMLISAKIVDARTGERPSIPQFIGRYVAYYVSLLPLGLGFLWVAFDERKRGFHDMLAGTVVVRTK